MNVNDILNKLSENREIKKIISRISNGKYEQLSLAEKKSIYEDFNKILQMELDTYLELQFSKKEQDLITNSVQLYPENNAIVITGLDENPYFYLKEIVLANLMSLDDGEEFVQIGGVLYDANYMETIPSLVKYNNDNLHFVKMANAFVDKLIENIDNVYKREYQKIFDKYMTKEAEIEIDQAYQIYDKESKLDLFDKLQNISKNIKEMAFKKKLSKEELAALTINDIGVCFLNYNDGKKSKVVIKNHEHHLNQFVQQFFNEYSSFIKININNKNKIVINEHVVSDNDLFIDVLMQEVAKINKNNHIVEDLNKYFYSKLEDIDFCLINKNYEIVNYIKWTSIYKDNPNDVDMFVKSDTIFENLFNDKEFLEVVDGFLSGKKVKEDALLKIFEMLNNAYGHPEFKLILNNDKNVTNPMGESDETTVYLYLNNNLNKYLLLATLLHEYRHSVQYNEVKKDSGIYTEEMLKQASANQYITMFNHDYNYVTTDVAGYYNQLAYIMQPIEFDAERFSEKAMRMILSNIPRKHNFDFKHNFLNYYAALKFFNNQKMSIYSYYNYLEINSVSKSIGEETEDYIYLADSLNKCNDFAAAIKIFKHRNFNGLVFGEKMIVYKEICKKYNLNIEYNKDKNLIVVNNKTIPIKTLSDYEILEKILLYSAYSLVKDGKIKRFELTKYIYDNSRLFKNDNYNVYNLMNVFYYHKTFDKYANNKKDKNKSKNGCKSR